jgi:hypothetical protein
MGPPYYKDVRLIGAILAPREQTITAILRVMGCSDEKPFQNYHRVLNRAKWSSRELSRLLLVLLVRLFVAGNEPVIMGIDETIERRRGHKIAARGVYHDPVRSREFLQHKHYVLSASKRMKMTICERTH